MRPKGFLRAEACSTVDTGCECRRLKYEPGYLGVGLQHVPQRRAKVALDRQLNWGCSCDYAHTRVYSIVADVPLHVCMPAYMHAGMRVCVCVCVCVCVRACVRMVDRTLASTTE